MLDFLMSRTPVAASPNPADPFWYSDDPYDQNESDSGKIVNAETALAVPTVLACVRVLSDAVATLPCTLYERNRDGTKRKAETHPLQSLLHDQPNYYQTAVEFFDQGMHYITLRGNTLGEIKPGVRGSVDRIEWIHPARVVNVRQDTKGRKFFDIESGTRTRTIPPERSHHVQGMSSDGKWGISVIGYLRNAIGMAMGAEQLGNTLFKQGIRPSGTFKHPGSLSQTAYDRLKMELQHNHGGSGNAHRAIVLEEGMEWQQMSVTPEDAQFLETRKFQIEEICRVFRVPLHMVQHLDRATFNNIEHLGIDFVVHTLRPWLVRFEQAIKRDLIAQTGKYFVEFNVDGLLRGDISSRYEAYAKAIQHEFMSPDEARAKENWNPRPDGKGGEYRNPVTRPKDVEQPVQVPDDRLSQLVQSYATDIGKRIAARENAQLSKRSKHAATDREKFNLWCSEFYTEHAVWIDQAITPLCDCLGTRDMDKMHIVEQLTKEAVAEWCSTDNPEQLAERYTETREQFAINLITETVL